MEPEKEEIKSDLEDDLLTVVGFTETAAGLGIHADFKGTEEQLLERLGDAYAIEAFLQAPGKSPVILSKKV